MVAGARNLCLAPSRGVLIMPTRDGRMSARIERRGEALRKQLGFYCRNPHVVFWLKPNNSCKSFIRLGGGKKGKEREIREHSDHRMRHHALLVVRDFNLPF
jgi:hypothetical protein